MPLMPAREPQPLPLALGRARLEFDALLDRRVRALAAGLANGAPGSDAERDGEAAQLLDALARGFADAVDRGNDSRQMLRQTPVDYVDAVVLTGTAGELLVDAVEYDEAPAYWSTRAGEVDSVIRGRDLDAYLRTGEDRYAAAIGLR